MRTYVPLEKRQWKQWAFVGGLLALWLAGLVTACLIGVASEQVWLGGEIVARYGLALPGGLVGAWGLRRQAYRTIRREQLPLVKPRLRVTGFALGLFALFGGLIGPAASFFPANVVNQEALLEATGIPISLLRGLCGLALTHGVVRALCGPERDRTLAGERGANAGTGP